VRDSGKVFLRPLDLRWVDTYLAFGIRECRMIFPHTRALQWLIK
jgi:hypothetical protein